VDAENHHDRERVLATYTRESPVFEDVPAGRRYVGADEIVGNYRHLWDGFPGLVRRIDRWTFGDGACVIELTLTGTHDGAYRGVAATGASWTRGLSPTSRSTRTGASRRRRPTTTP
jgi:hypothetical protein